MNINPGFISLIFLALVHLFSDRIKALGTLWHGRFLSFAAGISFSYVFIDLLPALAKGQPAIKRSFESLTPYFDRHTYFIALLGMLFYYGLQTNSKIGSKSTFYASFAGSLVLNLFVGASLFDSKDPELQPLALFTFALGMHYFIQDHYTNERSPMLFNSQARWILVLSLFIGYLIGWQTRIPDSIVAVCVSFIAGGIFLNVLHYELPNKDKGGYPFFALGSLIYAIILAYVGEG